MCINAKKSQLMILFPPANKSDLTLDLADCKIKHQEQIKVLGVTLSSNMKFEDHIWKGDNNMCKRINTKIALLKTVKPFISEKALGEIAANLVNSTLLYAAPLWGSSVNSNIDKLQSTQTKAARVVNNKAWKRQKKKSHRQELLNQLNWPNTKQIIHMATANITKKAIMGKSSVGMDKMF